MAIVVPFAVLLIFASHIWLATSTWFWQTVMPSTPSYPTAALTLEAQLRLRRPGATRVAVVGSSIAGTNVAVGRLARTLGIRPAEIWVGALPGAPHLEIAMLAPRLERLEADLVLLLAPSEILLDDADWQGLRFYDPPTAWALASAAELWHDRGAHLSHLLNASHVVLRHREAIRRVVLPSLFALPPAGHLDLYPDQVERQRRRSTAPRSAFSCDAIHVRALDHTARRLAEHGTAVAVAFSPNLGRTDRGLGLADDTDACLRALAASSPFTWIGAADLRLPGAAFRDATHFNRRGRRVFTDHVAPVLRRMLDGRGSR